MRTAEKAGIKAVADEIKCPLVEFNKPILPPKRGGKIFKQLEIDQTVLEADVVINLPKFKTHSLTLLTLGVKNLFGCIPGPRKALWHLKAGEDRKTFAQILVDVYQIIHPSLTILDGIVGMEGNGPNSGRPIQLGLILASGDPLSLDQIVCDLLGISRESLLTNRVAFDQGLGKDKIDVFGERAEDVKISNFQFPTLSQPDWNLPGFLRKALKNALTSKPVIEEEVCDACDRCAEICPPKALARKGKDLIFDYEQCIRCFCCLEVCPEGAISIKPGWALRLIHRRGNS
jgi:ferredoxin